MLLELRIENLLLIERAELRLGPGLNVITGETGAGKTVLAHSLDLLMGGKAKSGVVRPGANEAWVEGTFELPHDLSGDTPEFANLLERLPADAEEITLGRRVSAGGRTSAFIGGRSATAAELALLGGRLLAFYGQHQHRRLTIASAQMDILDHFGGPELIERRERGREQHGHHRALAAELAELRADDGARERERDILAFELEEIDQAAPRAGELAELEEEAARLRHVVSLREATETAAAAFEGENPDAGRDGAIGAGRRALEALTRVSGIDPNLDELSRRGETLALELEDLGSELRAQASRLEADPERLQAVEGRITLLDRLQRKYGGDLDAVLAHAETARQRLAQLEGGAGREQELAEQVEAAADELRALSEILSSKREAAAAALKRAVTEELSELAMDGASLGIELQPREEGPGPNGAERIEFKLATNPGMAAASLRDAASGGELSRVMLALTQLGDGVGADQIKVFDEIDAGIGGNTATVVGEKLRRLGAAGQVLAITHLPQVASQAQVHLRVVKDSAADPARATVERLEGEQVVDEIRRMLGAEQSDEVALQHARKLVDSAAAR